MSLASVPNLRGRHVDGNVGRVDGRGFAPVVPPSPPDHGGVEAQLPRPLARLTLHLLLVLQLHLQVEPGRIIGSGEVGRVNDRLLVFVILEQVTGVFFNRKRN